MPPPAAPAYSTELFVGSVTSAVIRPDTPPKLSWPLIGRGPSDDQALPSGVPLAAAAGWLMAPLALVSRCAL
jgi:hypothetical protein